MGAKQKILTFLMPLVLVLSFAFTLTINSSVALAYPATDNKCEDGTAPDAATKECAETTRKAAGGAAATGTASGDDVGVTCAVEKIGWILCPIMEGAAKISDKAFDILADNFLRTDPELVKDNSGTKVGWEVARNLANIMFIIAFLVIILSQVTGRGLNNYGIKKMLPRLIIAAIAVNVSYYICQLAVDITNILGYEIQNAMVQIANTVGPSVFGQASNYSDTEQSLGGVGQVFQNGAILSMIVTGALGLGVAVYFLLPTMVALIPLILITVMTVIIILLLRKALIVLLIVISPIAFVLYLLPNTEKYFSKWMSMFGKLLMVFPIVGLLFGAGQLASTIILVSGSDGNQAQAAAKCDPDNKESKDKFDAQKKGTSAGSSVCGEKYITLKGGKNGNNTCFVTTTKSCPVEEPKNLSWTLGLVAMGIAVAPLLAVWSVLQGALAAAGAIGGKLTSAVSKGMSGAGKPLNAGAGALNKRMKENRTAAWQRREARGLDGEGSLIDGVAGGFARRKGIRANRQNLSKHAADTAVNHAVLNDLSPNNPDGTPKLDSNGNPVVSKALSGLTASEQNKAIRAVEAQEEKHKNEEIQNFDTSFDRNNVSYDDIVKIAKGEQVGNMQGGSAQLAAIKRMAALTDIGALEDISKSATSSPEARQYLGRMINQNFSAIKSKGAHLTDSKMLANLQSGTQQTEASLNESMDRAMGGMAAELMATQKPNSLNRIATNVAAGSSNAASAKSAARSLRLNTQLFDKVSRSDRITIQNISS